MRSAFHFQEGALFMSFVVYLITGRNLYPYIRLGPQELDIIDCITNLIDLILRRFYYIAETSL
jgi:hypothetical protein